jgi:hypothetical protein
VDLKGMVLIKKNGKKKLKTRSTPKIIFKRINISSILKLNFYLRYNLKKFRSSGKRQKAPRGWRARARSESASNSELKLSKVRPQKSGD